MKLYTSFVSPATFRGFIAQNILPIFIIRNIKTSELIGHFDGSIIHFKELAPSNELFRQKRDGFITMDEFNQRYVSEISSQNLLGLFGKIEYLAELANTDQVVLLGYGSKADECHRNALSSYLIDKGIWKGNIYEI